MQTELFDVPLEDAPAETMVYLIGSRDGWWSNSEGWTTADQAFLAEDPKTFIGMNGPCLRVVAWPRRLIGELCTFPSACQMEDAAWMVVDEEGRVDMRVALARVGCYPGNAAYAALSGFLDEVLMHERQSAAQPQVARCCA